MSGEFTRDERRLLLYLETRIVDHSGRVNAAHMNRDDFEIVKRWDSEGFVGFGRIASEDCNSDGAHWVSFSDDAWETAHKERRARGDRLMASRRYMTTEEKRNCVAVHEDQ